MNFAVYAESLPGTVLDQLYQSTYVCQAVLHSLPPLAKQYVVRMLHTGSVPTGKIYHAPLCLHHITGASAPSKFDIAENKVHCYSIWVTRHAEWLDQWATPQAGRKHEAAVDKLTQLQLLKQSAPQRGPRQGLELSSACYGFLVQQLSLICPAGPPTACMCCTLIFNNSSKQLRLESQVRTSRFDILTHDILTHDILTHAVLAGMEAVHCWHRCTALACL